MWLMSEDHEGFISVWGRKAQKEKKKHRRAEIDPKPW